MIERSIMDYVLITKIMVGRLKDVHVFRGVAAGMSDHFLVEAEVVVVKKWGNRVVGCRREVVKVEELKKTEKKQEYQDKLKEACHPTLCESRVNWVTNPAPPAYRRPTTEVSPAPTPAILMPSSGPLRSRQDARNPGEGEEGRLIVQPITIRHPARLTSRPRLSEQPMKIQLAGERPSPGQQPMTSLR